MPFPSAVPEAAPARRLPQCRAANGAAIRDLHVSQVKIPALRFAPAETAWGEDVPRHYPVSPNSSRPISMRLISLVPAPISYSLASRSSRPVG